MTTCAAALLWPMGRASPEWSPTARATSLGTRATCLGPEEVNTETAVAGRLPPRSPAQLSEWIESCQRKGNDECGE